jgi:hypothetical protein
MVVLLAYKRYIHKKGKRHGPYYYKNVRDKSGKVRSVYLGKVTSRGKKPLEVTIVFLTVLLIIISALFFIQNRNIVLSRIAAEEAMVPFEVDQILIKVLVKDNEYIEKELRVMNVGDGEVPIEVYASGISDIVNVLDSGFTIKPGQTKIVRLNFSSFNAAEGIEQSPGVYIGKILVKTDSYEKEVPVIIEIESKNVLFDMNLNPVARDRSVLQGSSTTFEIRVFNLQSIDSFNVGMDFFVKDINGNTIVSEKESVVVKTQASFFKTLKIPKNLKTGNYVFAAQASFGDSIGTASYLFDVGEIAEEKRAAKFIEFCRNDPLCWALSIIVLLLMFTIGAYAYFFIGAFIYQKLFGVGVPKKSAEEIEAEKQIAKEKKENPIISSFRHWSDRIRRANERRAKKKLEFERQKLKLQEDKERLKEKQLMEKEERKGLIGKCRKLIDEGYRALDKDNLRGADKKYTKLMDNYIKLPSDRKAEIFKEINSFYKSLLLKTQQLKKKEEKEKKEEREREIEKKKQKELEVKRKEEERVRKLKLREERRREIEKKVFEFFHGLGFVKDRKEKEEIARKQQEEEKREQGELWKRKKDVEDQEEIWRQSYLEEKTQKELEVKRKEEEKRRKELEKKRKQEEERKRKEEEKRRKELEKKRKQEEERKRKEEEKRLREIEIKRRETERRKKQQEENKKLREIQELKKSITEKDAKINKLKEEIKGIYSNNKAAAKEISDVEKDIDALNNEKKMLFKIYNESVGSSKQLAEERKNRLAEWKAKYDAKVKEKNQVREEVNQEYENRIKELEDELEGLSHRERIEQEKWKKLELKAKYKLEEKEKEKTIREEIKGLQAEKREIEKEFNEKKQNLGKGVGGESILQRQKDIDDHIRAYEEDIDKLKKEISNRETVLNRYENSIEKLEEEKEKTKSALRDKRKGLGGLNYLASFFKFTKKVEPKEKEEPESLKSEISNSYESSIRKKERVDEKGQRELERRMLVEEKKKKQKELEVKRKEKERVRKLKLREERRRERKKKVFEFFHGLGFVKTDKEKKEYARQKRKLIEHRELGKKREEEGIVEREKLEEGGKRVGEEHDLEKSLKELGEVFEKRKEKKKHGIIHRLIKREKKAEHPEKVKAKAELKRKLAGKSRAFIKCHKLLTIADKALQNNDILKAKKLYLKTRGRYIKLEYLEKKEIYNELTMLYNKLSKGGK